MFYNVLISGAIFFGVTLICVILYTLRSITLIKCSTFVSALITALAFGVNTIAIKLTAQATLFMSVPLTILANFIGVYIAKWIIKTFTKDKLWRISCSVPFKKNVDTGSITNKLLEYNIEYNLIPYNGGNIIDIFSKSQGESVLIKEIITLNNIKYTVQEIDKLL